MLSWWRSLTKKKLYHKKHPAKQKHAWHKRKTPSQKAKNIAQKYGLSTRGNTTEILSRAINFLTRCLEEYKRTEAGIPVCFGVTKHIIICHNCKLEADCALAQKEIRDVKKVYREYKETQEDYRLDRL